MTLETQVPSLNLTAHLSTAVPTSQSGFALKEKGTTVGIWNVLAAGTLKTKCSDFLRFRIEADSGSSAEQAQLWNFQVLLGQA